MKLPCLYLMDSIVKNHPQPYRDLFGGPNLIDNFAHVFENVDVETRLAMHKLRNTWGEIFSRDRLYQLDLKVRTLDPKWPVVVPVASAAGGHAQATNIHINPGFINKNMVGITI